MSELKKTADNIFKCFPNENKVFVTSDGQAFLNESHAKNHAKNNRTGKELKLETFLREDEKKLNGDLPTAAADLITLINASTEIEKVQAILDAENKGGKRSTVIAAANTKIAELTKPE